MNKNVKMGVYTRNGKDNNFYFYTSLSAFKKMQFVNAVSELVVGTNYNSVIRDMIFDYEIIDIFTDVDTNEITKSTNSIDVIEQMLDETNIVKIVKANAKSGLIDELNKAVDDNIEYLTGIHKNVIADSLSHLLNTIEKKIADINIDEMTNAAKVINDIKGDFTPEGFLEAYSKTDMFKNKYDEILKNAKKHEDRIENLSKSKK